MLKAGRLGLEEACLFHGVHGTLDVPISYVSPTGFPLGQWLANRRRERRRGLLDRRVEAVLAGLGFEWDPAVHVNERWLAGYRKFHAESGHGSVPAMYASDGVFLGSYLARCRQRLKRGVLPQELADALDAVSTDWRGRPGYRKSVHWGPLAWLPAVEAWYREQGNLRIPWSYRTPEGLSPAQWLSRMRARLRSPQVSAEAAQIADTLDSWDARWRVPTPGRTPNPVVAPGRTAVRQRRATPESAYLAAARAFRSEHGHCDIPSRFITQDGIALGKWLANQRSLRRRSRLPVGRREALEELGVDWNVRRGPKPRAAPTSASLTV